MLFHFIKISWRSLSRYPVYTGINLLGLTIGIACCLLMLSLIRHEYSYDRFHRKADRIFRVVTHQQGDPAGASTVSSPIPLAGALRDEFPEIEEAVRLGKGWDGVIQYEGEQHHEHGMFFADPSVFKVFDLEMAQGNPETALSHPNGIVVTERMAEKYFGDKNPMGRILTYTFEGSMEFEVTGVVKALPENAHFHFDFLTSLSSQSSFLEMVGENWNYHFIPTYLLLRENADWRSVENRLGDFVDRTYPETSNSKTLSLQPLTDIHLHSHYEGEIGENGSVAQVRFYAGIALLLLLIACVNFMNLATARSAERIKEVGVRKVTGAGRGQLIRQFLGEACVLTLIATVMGRSLTYVLLPWFNDLTGKSLPLQISGWQEPLVLLALALATGLIAGSYPAFFLSGFQPVKILKGLARDGKGAHHLRRLLVTGQFAVSVIFLTCILTLQQQLDFIRNKPLGYDKEQVAFIRTPQREEPMNFELWRSELRSIAGIREATGASLIPGSGQPIYTMKMGAEGTGDDARIEMAVNFIEHDFAETFGLEFAAGRDFSPAFVTDPGEGLLINEAAAQALGWGSEALGKRLAIFRPDRQEEAFSGRVIGILKNFHFQSLHHAIRPMVLTCRPVFNRTWIALRMDMEDLSATRWELESAWKKLAPEWPMELSYLDEAAVAHYEQEQRTGKAVAYASLLAIIIACLGLFGLSAYAAEQRTKEIGIRKVFGAGVAAIVGLLSKDFLKLVFIAILIAAPLAWYAMNRWLQGFAYRIEMQWWVFAAAGAGAVAIAVLTVSWQAIRAALKNPVESLRNE